MKDLQSEVENSKLCTELQFKTLIHIEGLTFKFWPAQIHHQVIAHKHTVGWWLTAEKVLINKPNFGVYKLMLTC